MKTLMKLALPCLVLRIAGPAGAAGQALKQLERVAAGDADAVIDGQASRKGAAVPAEVPGSAGRGLTSPPSLSLGPLPAEPPSAAERQAREQRYSVAGAGIGGGVGLLTGIAVAILGGVTAGFLVGFFVAIIGSMIGSVIGVDMARETEKSPR